MRVMAIDPGTTESAWIIVDTPDTELAGKLTEPFPVGIAKFGKSPNADILPIIRGGYVWTLGLSALLIEQIQGMGMAVGKEVFETVRWTGRFEEAHIWHWATVREGAMGVSAALSAQEPPPVLFIPRRTVKQHLCGSDKAKDQNIRQAVIDRWGGTAATRKGGALYGISADVWQALALAVTWIEREEGQEIAVPSPLTHSP